MKGVVGYLFKEKLAFLIVNVFAIVVSSLTIGLLIAHSVTIGGEISYSTIFIVIVNSLFLVIKTTLNIFSLIVQYKYKLEEEENISPIIKSFKELLDKEDFRL